MKLEDAIRSGKPFRRIDMPHAEWNFNANEFQYSATDILSEWEVKVELQYLIENINPTRNPTCSYNRPLKYEDGFIRLIDERLVQKLVDHIRESLENSDREIKIPALEEYYKWVPKK